MVAYIEQYKHLYEKKHVSNALVLCREPKKKKALVHCNIGPTLCVNLVHWSTRI